MAFLDCRVEVAHSVDAEDILPAMMLLKDAEQLVLMDHLAQYLRILLGGDAQEGSLVIWVQTEHAELTGVGEQRTVVVVYVVVYLVVCGI